MNSSNLTFSHASKPPLNPNQPNSPIMHIYNRLNIENPKIHDFQHGNVRGRWYGALSPRTTQVIEKRKVKIGGGGEVTKGWGVCVHERGQTDRDKEHFRTKAAGKKRQEGGLRGATARGETQSQKVRVSIVANEGSAGLPAGGSHPSAHASSYPFPLRLLSLGHPACLISPPARFHWYLTRFLTPPLSTFLWSILPRYFSSLFCVILPIAFGIGNVNGIELSCIWLSGWRI